MPINNQTQLIRDMLIAQETANLENYSNDLLLNSELLENDDLFDEWVCNQLHA